MTSIKSTLARLIVRQDAAEAPLIEPTSIGDLCEVLEFASDRKLRVLPVGAGTHRAPSGTVAMDLRISTGRLPRVFDWEPDDLTLVVSSAVTVGEITSRLSERRQTALLPEGSPDATVGGVVASGLSGWRRLRYGPTRDRVLQVEMVTGDGRHIVGGGRVVKNVTGYDVPRLITGSLGSLGVIVSVCLKLWPDPPAAAMVSGVDPSVSLQRAHRPQAVLQTEETTTVYLGGTVEAVAAEADALGGRRVDGWQWPVPLEGVVLEFRVPPGSTADAVARLGDQRFQAQHGVGLVDFEAVGMESGEIARHREWAESLGGSLVVTGGGVADGIDRWGRPPGSLALQRRVKAAFDPIGIMSPGRLPGGL